MKMAIVLAVVLMAGVVQAQGNREQYRQEHKKWQADRDREDAIRKSAVPREWVPSRSKTVIGQITKYEKKSIFVSTFDGRDVEIPFAELSKEDQKYVRDWKSGAIAKQQQAAESKRIADLKKKELAAILAEREKEKAAKKTAELTKK